MVVKDAETTYVFGHDAMTGLRSPHYHVLVGSKEADDTGLTRCGKRLQIVMMLRARKPADDHLCAACARTMNGENTVTEEK